MYCRFCRTEVGALSNHHIFPKRIWGNTANVEKMCQDCHNRVEILICEMEKRLLRLPADYSFRDLNPDQIQVLKDNARLYELCLYDLEDEMKQRKTA